MTNLTFMECQNSDINAVVELINSAYRQNHPNAWTTEANILSGKRIEQGALLEILNNANNKVYVAKIDDNVIGSICTKFAKDKINIGLFAIDQNIQNGGIGKKLLEYAEQESAKIWQASYFTMEVISNRTELINFYVRRGYINTNKFLKFPTSELWQPLSDDLKLVCLRKKI